MENVELTDTPDLIRKGGDYLQAARPFADRWRNGRRETVRRFEVLATQEYRVVIPAAMPPASYSCFTPRAVSAGW